MARYAGIDYTEQWENIGQSWERFVEGYKEDLFAAEERAYCALSQGLPEVIGEHIRDHFSEYTTVEGANPFDLSPRTPQAQQEHPFWRRFQWHPLAVAVPFTYLWYVSYIRDFPFLPVAGACFVSLWFLMAVADFVTRHKLLDCMYGTDNPDG